MYELILFCSLRAAAAVLRHAAASASRPSPKPSLLTCRAAASRPAALLSVRHFQYVNVLALRFVCATRFVAANRVAKLGGFSESRKKFFVFLLLALRAGLVRFRKRVQN